MKRLLFILGLLFALLPPLQGWAAVTIDSICGSGESGNNGTTGHTVSCTVGVNSNRGIVIGVGFDDNATSVGTVTVAFDGVAATQLQAVDYATATRSARLYELHADASIHTGIHNLTVTWTGGHTGTAYLGMASMYNVDQTTGAQNSGSDTGTCTGTGCATSTVTSTSGNMAVVMHSNNNASSTAINAGNEVFTDTCCNTNAGMGYLASSGSSTVLNWTLGSSVAYLNLKVDMIAVSAGGPDVTPFYKRRNQ